MDVLEQRTGRWRRVVAVALAAAAVTASQSGVASAADVVWTPAPVPGSVDYSTATDWVLSPGTDPNGTVYGFSPNLDQGYGYTFKFGPSFFKPGNYDQQFLYPTQGVTDVAAGSNGLFFGIQSSLLGVDVVRYQPNGPGTYSTTTIASGNDQRSGVAVLADGDVVTAVTGFGIERYDYRSGNDSYGAATYMAVPNGLDAGLIDTAEMATSSVGDLYVTLHTADQHSYLVEYPHATLDQPVILESDAPGKSEYFNQVAVNSQGTVFMVVNSSTGISIQQRTAAGVRSVVRDISANAEAPVTGLSVIDDSTLLYDSAGGLQFLKAAAALVKPSSPTAVSVSTSGGSATVTWQAPADTGSSPLSEYGVYRFVGAGAQTQSTQICGGSTAEITESFDDLTSITTYSCTVTGLASGTYRFGVRAISDAGYSKPAMVKFSVVVPVAFTTDLPAVSGPTPDGLVTMTVAVSGDPAPRLVWQRSLDNGTTWKNVKTEKNATTVTRAYSAKLEGAQFRAVAYPKGQPAVFSTVTTVHD